MTPERKIWWDSLPQEEKYLREQLCRLKKWDIAKQKKLLDYPENTSSESQRFISFTKNNIRLLKKTIKVIKRSLPVRPYINRNGVYCTCCDCLVVPYMDYCPECGHKLKWQHNTIGGNRHGA